MKNEDVRKLVSFKVVEKIKPIENADAIELVCFGGWQVVVKKDEFKVGDKVIYFEIDSFLPKGIKQFAFLVEKSSKKALDTKGNEVVGHVLKTIRLRGAISQGLVLNPKDFDKELNTQKDLEDYFYNELGVFKYEKPLPLDTTIIGNYPNFTPKTDSERVQNLSDEILQKLGEKCTWKATEKVDGTSSTWWKDENGNIHAASRNYEIAIVKGSVHYELIKKYKLDEILKPNEIIKGEIVGEGIQKNPLKIQGKKLLIFEWESPNRDLPKELEDLKVKEYDLSFPKTVEEAVAQVYGLKSLVNPNVQAEGIVWWNKEHEFFEELDFRPNFKAINNKYLLK